MLTPEEELRIGEEWQGKVAIPATNGSFVSARLLIQRIRC